MKRRRRNSRTSRRIPPTHKATNVTVNVPRSLAPLLPSTVYAEPIRPIQHRSRHRTVPLRKVPGPTVRKRFKVIHPRKHEYSPPAYSAVDRYGRLRVYSNRKTMAYLASRRNRPTREEYGKERGRRRRHGQIESMRYDRTGIVRANINQSTNRLMDSAMVARAVEKYV